MDPFKAWMLLVNHIADQHGLTPKDNPTEAEMQTWREQYEAGKTPKEAWDGVPWVNRHGEIVR